MRIEDNNFEMVPIIEFIKEFRGSLEISLNPLITDIGLLSFHSVTGDLTIYDNKNLASIGRLPSFWPSGTSYNNELEFSTFTVVDNPALPYCEICGYTLPKATYISDDLSDACTTNDKLDSVACENYLLSLE